MEGQSSHGCCTHAIFNTLRDVTAQGAVLRHTCLVTKTTKKMASEKLVHAAFFFSWRSGGFPRHRVFAKVSVYARACYALACNVRVWWVRRFSQRVVDSLGLLNTG